MHTTALTVGAIFTIGLALALPLGWLFRVHLADGRYTHIDGMRAIAALMVVCSHAVPQIRLLAGESPETHLSAAFGPVGVQIFFGITAFLFARKAMAGPIDVRALIESRINRVVPLFFVCTTAAIVFAIYLATTVTAPGPLLLSDILKAYGYGFLGGNVPSIAGVSLAALTGQAWTLAWEWSFYLLVPFLAPVLTDRRWRLYALAFAAACAYYQLRAAEQIWVFFIPGILAALVERKAMFSRGARVALFLCGIAAYGLSLAIEAKSYGPARLILSCVGFPCLIFGYQGVLALRPLRLLGEVSYSIYLVHVMVVTGFMRITTDEWRELFPTFDDKVQLGLIMTGSSFALCFVTYALFERPFMRKAPRQSGRTASAPSSASMDLAQ